MRRDPACYYYPKGLCKVNTIPEKKIGSGWVGPGPICIKKKVENRPKIKFCVCDSIAVRLTKFRISLVTF